MSVTPDTSQDPIDPCTLTEPSVDSVRHSAMAAWNSVLDFGAQAMVDRAVVVVVLVR